MKRVLVLLLIVSMFVSVIAAEMPSAGIGGEDVEEIKGAIEDYSPLDESGQVDFGKYKPFVTKAEIRIEAINIYLEENASWLKVVFGMVPSITWLFFVNMWVWLIFFLMLVLSGNVFNIEFFDKKFDLFFFEVNLGHIVGAIVFSIMVGTKILANLATFAYDSWVVVWNYILPWGPFAVVLAIVVLVGLLIYFPVQVMAFSKWLGRKYGKRRGRKEAEKEAVNREILEKTIEGIAGE